MLHFSDLDMIALWQVPARLVGRPCFGKALLAPCHEEALCIVCQCRIDVAAMLGKVMTACANGVSYPLAPVYTSPVLLSKLEVARDTPRGRAREAILRALMAGTRAVPRVEEGTSGRRRGRWGRLTGVGELGLTCRGWGYFGRG